MALFSFPNYSFTCNQVRDLAHACFGHNLINNFAAHDAEDVSACNIVLTEERWHWLRQLDRDPAPLLSHLEGLKSRRLGLYFEALWQFFIRCDSQLELIAHNLPVFDGSRTLGEFDILYLDTDRDEYVHLELAVKFFLNNDKQSLPAAFEHWLGPNATDRLDRKLNHLLGHQIQLSEHAAAQSLLASHGINKLRKEIALKGILFYPANIQPKQSLILSPEHNWSHWFFLNNTHHLSDENAYWVILPKLHWLSPLSIPSDAIPGHDLIIVSSDELSDYLSSYFGESNKPIMLCKMEKTNSGLNEKTRYFITPNDWPEEMMRKNTSAHR